MVANWSSDDISILLKQCPPVDDCLYDFNDGGVVSFVDLLILIFSSDFDGEDFLALVATWGPCP